jgi:hypothetical protein
VQGKTGGALTALKKEMGGAVIPVLAWVVVSGRQMNVLDVFMIKMFEGTAKPFIADAEYCSKAA